MCLARSVVCRAAANVCPDNFPYSTVCRDLDYGQVLVQCFCLPIFDSDSEDDEVWEFPLTLPVLQPPRLAG